MADFGKFPANRLPVDTGRTLNVHKTFRRRPGRLMYVQFTSCVYGAWYCVFLMKLKAEGRQRMSF